MNEKKLLKIVRNIFAPADKNLAANIVAICNKDRQIREHKDELLVNALTSTDQKIRKLQKDYWEDNYLNTNYRVKLEASTSKIKEVNVQILDTEVKLGTNANKLSKEEFINHDTLKELTRNKEYLPDELKKLNNSNSELVKEVQDTIDKSDIFSSFLEFLEKYQAFVDQLGLEQQVAIFNIIGLCMVFFALQSISTILVGDYLIEKLKLEIRFPKLAKYIRIRQSLNKHFLMYYIVLLYTIVIVFILGDIYMLVLKYFV